MYIQEKGANRNICQQVCCITFGETSSGPVFGNEIEKKRFLDMLLNAIQDLKINVYAYCVLDYEPIFSQRQMAEKRSVWRCRKQSSSFGNITERDFRKAKKNFRSNMNG